MVLHVLRTLFVLLMGAVGWYYLQHPTQFLGKYTWLVMAMSLTLAVFTVCVDILSPRQKLTIFSGAFFGLVVGLLIAYAMTFVVRMVVEQLVTPSVIAGRFDQLEQFEKRRDALIFFIEVLIGVTACYLCISFTLQAKDDFRFIIPFVEFSKERRGARPMLLDTSVLIDGRVADIAATGLIESQVVVPRFVLEELQAIADSPDKLKRARGRRGLDVLGKLQGNRRVEVVLYDAAHRDEAATSVGAQAVAVEELTVDNRLLALGRELNARVLTNDYNLNKVAQLRGVDVVNINQLALALKPVVLPGERLTVRLVKPGDQPGQGVGYLDDGTMVIVEGGRSHLNEEVDLSVTSSLQNNTGKMVFGKLLDAPTAAPPPPVPTLKVASPTPPQTPAKPKSEKASA